MAVEKIYIDILTRIKNALAQLNNQDKEDFNPIKRKFCELKCEALINLAGYYQIKEKLKPAIKFYNQALEFAENLPKHTRISNEKIDRAKLEVLAVCLKAQSTFDIAPKKLVNYAKCVESTKAIKIYAEQTKIFSAETLAGEFIFYAANSLCSEYQEQKKVTDLKDFAKEMTKSQHPKCQILGFSRLGDCYIQEKNKPDYFLQTEKSYKNVISLYEKNKLQGDVECQMMVSVAAVNMAVSIRRQLTLPVGDNSDCRLKR